MIIRVGLIGLGKIGAIYDLKNNNLISHLKTILNDNRFTLEFAYDPDIKKCTLVKREYNLVNVFDNIDELKETKPCIDLLVIASPTQFHLDSIELFIQFTKPDLILCEKPLAKNMDNSNKIKLICEQNNISIVSNFMRRSLPAFKDLKNHLQKNSKDRYDVIVKYSGCFKNNGSHFVDLMYFFFGPAIKVSHLSSESEADSIYKVRAVVQYKNATCSFIPLFSNQVSDHEIQIMSETSKVLITRAGRNMKIYSTSNDADFEDGQEYIKIKDVNTDYLKFQKHVYNDLYEALNSGTMPKNLCVIEDAVKNIKFIEELIK